MADNLFRVELEGSDEDKGQIRLYDLVLELDAIQKTLNQIDHFISRSDKSSMYVLVKGLSYASPYRFEFETKPRKVSYDHTPAIVDRFFSGLDLIKSGKDPIEFNRGLIESFQEIGNGFKRKIRRIGFYNTKSAVTLTENLDEPIKKLLGNDEFVTGFVTGILEAINIHGDRNRFIIYPIAGADKVECSFPKELFETAVKGLARKVNIRGKIKYRGRDRFPYSIAATNIEIFPDDEKLPSFMDLEGIAPNATGELTSEEFVRRLR